MYLMKNKPKNSQTAESSKYPQGYFKEKACRKCGTKFQPEAPSSHYCSDPCKDEAHVDAYLKRKYGIVYQDYQNLLEDQNHLCKLCHTEGWTMAKHHVLKLVVDHDHKTGKVRGLLCHNCNRALGLFKDNKESLLRAIEYLNV